MSYTVFARKYRPQTFRDLYGQEAVTRTLGNALKTGRVAHAFLFTGVRGVGKTTTARILAKALNCEQGPTSEPCGICDPCREITVGLDLDVLEIDGASNNSVDDVRRLQETIPFRPSRDRFKIVIVDEVHMLSTGAFNAFLKTLEEPPAHVKFIFATTESHKVPVTIRSRCQRYDFRLIPEAVVAERIRVVLQNEGISADSAAIALVAREAAGSMRDALTLLDQVVASCGTTLVGSEIAALLGLADRAALEAVFSALTDGDGKACLEQCAAIVGRGVDPLHFCRALASYARDLTVIKVAGTDTHLVEMASEERARAGEFAERSDVLELERLFASLSQLVQDVGKASLPATVLEMGLLRLTTRPKLLDIATLLAERESSAPGRTTSPSRSQSSAGTLRAEVQAPRVPETKALASAPPQRSSAPSATSAPIERRESAPLRPSNPAPMASAHVAPMHVSASRDAQASAPPGAEHAGHSASSWEALVGVLGETKPALGAVLQHAVPIHVGADRIEVAFGGNAFYAAQADAKEAREAVLDVAARVLGGKPVFTVHRDTPNQTLATPQATLAQVEDERKKARIDATKKRALNHPMVVETLSVFEATVEHTQVTDNES